MTHLQRQIALHASVEDVVNDGQRQEKAKGDEMNPIVDGQQPQFQDKSNRKMLESKINMYTTFMTAFFWTFSAAHRAYAGPDMSRMLKIATAA
jgi:hypothetical protein